MKNAKFIHGSSFWVGTLAILGFFLLALPNSGAQAAPANSKVSFDHVKTGFPLTGAHVTLPCETCHIQGTFKGTPKKCATCHTQGSRIQTTTFKLSNHLVTTQACEQCHTSTASWSVAHFSHAGVIPHQCSQCHNGNITKGKPSNHMPTNEPCDSCHRTTTWMSASFTHVSVMPGSCAQCHIQGGTATTFKASNHIPTNLPCDACHTTGGSFATSRFTHSATQGAMAGQCASSGCHDGSHTSSNALGKTPNHVATSASCDQCHTGFVTFAGANQHAGVIASAGTCANAGCHAPGGAGLPKPLGNSHIPTGALTCNICHNMTLFNPSTFNHSSTQGVVAGQCGTSCHSGTYAALNVLAKPGGNSHIPTNAACDMCHNMTTFNPSSFTHSATQGVLPGQCETCHSGTYAALNVLGKAQAPTTHATTSASCDTCHTGYSTFAGANNHAGVIASAGTCANAGCHASGGAGLPKPGGNSHIPTGLTCNWCHNMTLFNPSTFNHSSTQGVVAGQCGTSCHSGTYAALNVLGKAQAPTLHITTSASCDQCHTGYVTFANGTFNHTGIAPGSCANAGCHIQGGAGKVAPSNHIPYQSQLLSGSSMSCDACHTSTTSFTAERMNHNNSLGNGAGWCKGCHQSGTNFLGNMQKMSLTHNKSSGVTDCSQSGCHRPLGTQGTAYSRWTN